jgi:outer membrane protein TolC
MGCPQRLCGTGPHFRCRWEHGLCRLRQVDLRRDDLQPEFSSLTSGYSLAFNWRLSGDVLTNTGTQKANRRAVDADISAAVEQLRSDVTFQYLTALQAAAQTEVARQQVQRNT